MVGNLFYCLCYPQFRQNISLCVRSTRDVDKKGSTVKSGCAKREIAKNQYDELNVSILVLSAYLKNEAEKKRQKSPFYRIDAYINPIFNPKGSENELNN